MSVPFVDLRREYHLIADQVNAAIKTVLERGSYILGEEVGSFESEFAGYIGRKFAVGVSSGTSALTIALESLGIGIGDDVLTSANTAIPTVTAILRAGATPVLVDPDEKDQCVDVTGLERALTKTTRAVIPVHLYGYPCDMDPIRRWAQEKGIKVIEDCAQAHGARIGERKAGVFGDAGCFSFYPTKNLGAYGDGGMLVTDDPDVAERARELRHHGQSSKDEHERAGMCARLDELQAAVLRVKMKFLDENNRRRREIAERYRQDLRHVILPVEAKERKSVYHLFVIRTEKRDLLREKLSERGISTAVHYPKPAHQQKAFSSLGYRIGDFPVSEKLSGEILSLPMFPELEEDEITRVIDSVNEILG